MLGLVLIAPAVWIFCGRLNSDKAAWSCSQQGGGVSDSFGRASMPGARDGLKRDDVETVAVEIES